MTGEEWSSLKRGSLVSNRKGTNIRPVLSYKNGSIKLPSDRDRAKQGYTVYCRGDKYLFKLVTTSVTLKAR